MMNVKQARAIVAKSHLTFTPTDHAHFTVICEDLGINFRISDLNLYAATPSGARVYAEDWTMVALLEDDGFTVKRLTDDGLWLADEAEGIIEVAIAALQS